MKIGILQTGHAPDSVITRSGDYPAMFARLLAGHGFDFVTYDVTAGQFPASAVDCDGWIVTGSRHGVYEDHPWLPPLRQLIQAIDESRRPLLGICFGHQIIAQALGGEVEKFSGGWSVGRTAYVIDGMDMALNAWHQDQVITPPGGARTIGHSGFCAHAALAYGPEGAEHILTIQPHPEFDAPVIEELIATRGDAVPDDLLARARAALREPTDAAGFAARMADFLLAGTAAGTGPYEPQADQP